MAFMVHDWIKNRGPRERVFLFILGFFIIYSIYIPLLLKPILAAKKDYQQKNDALNSQMMIMKTDMTTTLEAIKNDKFTKKMVEQQKLATQIQSLQHQLSTLKPLITPSSEIPVIIQSLLKMKNNNIAQISLKDMPSVLWVPNVADKNDVANIVSNDIFEHDMQLGFTSDYFSTVDFISRLEKLEWPLYWDRLTYKVSNYPNAQVAINIHLLTNNKS